MNHGVIMFFASQSAQSEHHFLLKSPVFYAIPDAQCFVNLRYIAVCR